MIQRSAIIIDKEKSTDFLKFIKINAKDRSFWDEIKKSTSSEIYKDDLEKCFKSI